MLKKISFLIVLFSVSAIFTQDAYTQRRNTSDNSFTASRLRSERAAIESSKKNHVWRKYTGRKLPEYEKLTYKVMWNFISVGEASLEIRGFEEINGRKAYHLYSFARSNNFFDSVFKVRDTNQAWMDEESMSVLRYTSDVSEGGWTKQEEVNFDQVQRTFLLYDNGKMQKGPIPPYVQDVFTALYYVRTMDLKVGDEFTLEAHSGDLSWPLIVKVLRREKIKIPLGEVQCLVLEPLVRKNAGLFNAQGSMLVWMTDDEHKIPVYLKAKLPFGAANAALEKYENAPGQQ